MTISDHKLIEHAKQAGANAYAPYSNFKVGAALLDDRGELYLGCNVENAAYPLGQCAEACAIGAMALKGGRKIAAIAIVGGYDAPGSCAPCGGCRQTIAEFSGAETTVLLLDSDGEIIRLNMDDLLPRAFSLPGAE